MMLYVVAFLACASPDRCRTVELPFDGSLLQCMLFGQQMLAAWTNDHPGWTVPRGYRCTTERSA